MHPAFQFDRYLLKRQVLALTGKLRLYDPNGNLALYCEQKMFRLKEDVRVYSDEWKTQELLRIRARQVIDFAAAYDIFDSQSGTRAGVLQRKGIRSWVRDEWLIFDLNEQFVGTLIEDDLTYALLRRLLLGSFLPQNYDVIIRGNRAADIRQRFNLLRYELDLDFRNSTQLLLDRRIGIAAGILLALIEGRQD
jgi:uncharacterized protein YxjI